MLPFALAHPSRSYLASIPISALEPQEARIKEFFEHREIEVRLDNGETTLPGPTGSWEKVKTTSYTQTQITFTPAPDFQQDSTEDETLEHSNNDDTSAAD